MMAPADDIRPERIGIMADSHGRTEALAAGVTTLRQEGCTVLYHLGDICDAAYPETTPACVDTRRQNDILAVKGNNEHTVSVNSLDRDDGVVSSATALWLGRLPLVRQLPGAVFCHSLPFEAELGLSAMVRVMEPAAALHFCRQYPGQVLFRGHSHHPEILRCRENRVEAETISPGIRLVLAASRPAVITCGALTDGLCLVWNPREDWIVSVTTD